MNKNALKKAAIIAASAAVALLPELSFALGTVGDAAVVSAFDSGTVSVGKVATGVIGMGAAYTGLGLVYSWLRR